MSDLRRSETRGWWVDGVPIHRYAYNVRLLGESAPARRGGNVEVARAPGERWRPKPYAARLQSWAMQAFDVDELGRQGPEALAYNIDRLKRIWHGDGQVTVERRITLPDGRHTSRTGVGEVVDTLDFEVWQNNRYGRLQVDLKMADPFWYEPPRQLLGKSGAFALANPGTVAHHNAVVRIHGPASDPGLLNLTSGSRVTVSGTIPDGGWVELDSAGFTAVDDQGGNMIGQVQRDDVWFLVLTPGINRLTLSSGTCDISWRAAFL